MLARTIFALASSLILTASAALIAPDLAEAQAVRYIASGGSNANNCSRAAPCKTLQRGIAVTPAGGELQILDSGAFGGSATINKSITISALGVAATVGSIVVNAPGAGVTLRGLTMNGTNLPGANGIAIQAAASVHIIDCQIERFSSRGIFITATAAQIFVTNTRVRRNPTHGLLLNIGHTFLTVEDSVFEANGNGIYVAGFGTRASISNTNASGNSGFGITTIDAEIGITASTVANNGAGGLYCSGSVANGPAIFVTSSVIRGNTAEGLRTEQGCRASISDSVFSANRGYGIRIAANAASGASSVTRSNIEQIASPTVLAGGIICTGEMIAIESSTFSGNFGTGLEILTSCDAVISNSSFFGNGTGVKNNAGGSLFTRGNNTFFEVSGIASLNTSVLPGQ